MFARAWPLLLLATSCLDVDSDPCDGVSCAEDEVCVALATANLISNHLRQCRFR